MSLPRAAAAQLCPGLYLSPLRGFKMDEQTVQQAFYQTFYRAFQQTVFQIFSAEHI
jgi:hypothetical protein